MLDIIKIGNSTQRSEMFIEYLNVFIFLLCDTKAVETSFEIPFDIFYVFVFFHWKHVIGLSKHDD